MTNSQEKDRQEPGLGRQRQRPEVGDLSYEWISVMAKLELMWWHTHTCHLNTWELRQEDGVGLETALLSSLGPYALAHDLLQNSSSAYETSFS